MKKLFPQSYGIALGGHGVGYHLRSSGGATPQYTNQDE
jgi:hypothetical protein